MAINDKLSKPGLIPVKVENQGSLITTQVNKINFTGSGVTASIGQFNDLTVLITGGGGSGISSSYALSASYAATASYFSGSISNAVSSSYALTASYWSGSILNATSASYAANGGVTQLLAGANISLSPTNGLGQVTITSTGGSGGTGNTATGSYGSFYDTTTQTNPVGNVPRSMSLNTTDITNGVSISGSTNPFNTYIKTTNAGVYNIQFSAQLDKTDSGTDEIVIWLRKNGSDLTDTATTVTLVGNNAKNVAAWNWFVNSAANDYYQIIWQSPDTNVRLFAEPLDGHPGIPSVIVTANRVDQFLSNTGSFSGSFTGSFVGLFTGSLLGTSSWAASASQAISSSFTLNAISASYALSSSFATTASYAYSASYEIIKEESSSFADTASYVNPLSQSVLITGSLGLTGSLNIFKSGSTVVDIQGSTGQLFSITDSLTGSLFSVNTVAGLPIIEAFSDNTVNIGKFGVYPIKVAATGTLAIITGSITGSFTGSLLGTSSFATTASWALNSRLLNGTASSVFATTGSNIFLGNQTITGSTNISGAFNLVGDINASSNNIVLNSPSIALPGLALPYTPSPTVRTVLFDTANNVLFVTSSLPGGGGSGLADRIQTGSITASVAIGSNPLYPHFFLLQSASRELLKFNTEGVMQLEAYYTTPTPITGGIYYSASGEFFFGS